MQIFGLDVPVWVLLLFSAATIMYYLSTKNHDYFTKMGLTGPSPWPLIGNMYDLIFTPLPTFCDNAVKQYGKVFGAFFGSTPVLWVADVEFVKEITVKQFSKFSDRRQTAHFSTGVFIGNLISLEGEHWKHVRSQLTGAFTSGKLKQMKVLIDRNVESLIVNLTKRSGQEIVIKEHTGSYTMDAIASTAFGILLDSHNSCDAPLLKHANQFVTFGLDIRSSMIVISVLFPTFGRLLAMLGVPTFPKDTTDYFTAVVQNQLELVADQETARNFIRICSDKLVSIEKLNSTDVRVSNGQQWSMKGLTETEILGNSLIFFLAGYETTATLLQFALYALARNPGIQQKLRDEVTEVAGDRVASYEELGKMEYMDWVINETLRMYPPFFLPNRKCVEDAMIKGIRIPKGTNINMCVYSIHHDPENWEDPESFKPERFDPENKPENFQYIFLPFGTGPRNCIGMRLALLKAKAALSRIVQTFDVAVTATTPKEPLTNAKGSILMKPALPLTLKVTRRT